MVEAETEREGKTTRERRYYLSSTKLDAATFARAVRAHWGIENRLHWMLDVVFNDDQTRLRTGHGPENMAVVRHMAITGSFCPCRAGGRGSLPLASAARAARPAAL
jgi:predicted transposase YbfD/YdcC